MVSIEVAHDHLVGPKGNVVVNFSGKCAIWPAQEN